MHWEYDELYRLKLEHIEYSNDPGRFRTTSYEYDEVGNREVMRLVTNTGSAETRYVYDHNDRLQSEGYTVLAGVIELDNGVRHAVAPPKPSRWLSRSFVAYATLATVVLAVPIGLLFPYGRMSRRKSWMRVISAVLAPMFLLGPVELHAVQIEISAWQAGATAISAAGLGQLGDTNYTYAFDDNGNLISRNDNAGTILHYRYDAQNRLVELKKSIDPGSPVSQATFTYDADGIRREKTDDTPGGTGVTRFLTDKNRDYAQVLEERNSEDQRIVRYTYGDDLIAQTRGTARSYYHYDGQLSARQLTNAPTSGPPSVTDSYEFDAFGV